MTDTLMISIPLAKKKVVDDVEFLDALIWDLRLGWTTGTMCDSTGKKCLVGAGASELGLNYAVLDAAFGPVSEGIYNTPLTEEIEETKSQCENDAAARIFRLLIDVPEYQELTGRSDALTVGSRTDFTGEVISFNDTFVPDHETLLRVLKAALTAAIEKRAALAGEWLA